MEQRGGSAHFLRGRYKNMSRVQAVVAVIEYIVANELYNFESLSKTTQEKLISAYGPTFAIQVNEGLGF